MDKLTLFLLLIYATISTLYTLYLRVEKIDSFKRNRNKASRIFADFQHNVYQELSIIVRDKNTYSKMFHIKTFNHLLLVTFIFSVFYISFIPPSQNIFIQVLGVIALFIIFYGIGVYINQTLEDSIINLLLYVLKLCVILSISFGFLVNFSELAENITLFILSFLFPLVYSFILLKNIMTNLSSILVQLFSFILILSCVLFIWGLLFGSFYFHNNDTYKLYNANELKQLDDDNPNHLLFIAYKGLDPFYSFPKIPKDQTLDNPIIYLPFIEFIIGYVFNAAFVGFFISYLVSKLIIYEEQKVLKKNDITSN